MLKILYVNGTANIGGAEVSLINLVKRMNKDIYSTMAVLPDDGPLAKKMSDMGIKVVIERTMEYSRRRPVSFLKAVLRLTRLIRSEGIGLVHANSIYISEQSLFASKLAGIPCICHVRDLAPILGAGRIRSIAFKKMARMIAISEAVKNDLIRKLNIPEEKIERIYNGVDTEEFNPGISGENFRREYNLGSSKLVGMAGRFSPEKGQDIFLRAAGEIVKEYKDIYFVVVGNADLGSETFRQEMVRLSASLGLKDKVIFTGFRNDFPRVMAALDIAVVPSAAEPFGRVIVEAMASGVPVVAMNSGAAPEIISSQTGVLVEPGNIGELSKATIELLNDVKKSGHMAEEARRAVLAKFDIRRHVSAVEKLYHEILAREYG